MTELSSPGSPHSLNSHTVTWVFPTDTPVLADHFPTQPIVPAYLQLFHIHNLACSLLNTSPGRVRVKSIKFLHPIAPGEEVDITCQVSPGLPCVTFSITQRSEVVTHGELVLE